MLGDDDEGFGGETIVAWSGFGDAGGDSEVTKSVGIFERDSGDSKTAEAERCGVCGGGVAAGELGSGMVAAWSRMADAGARGSSWRDPAAALPAGGGAGGDDACCT